MDDQGRNIEQLNEFLKEEGSRGVEQVLLSSSFASPLQKMLPDMAVEGEDDVFFADLSKQIALLIMDDEEDFPVQYCPPLPAQELPYMPQIMVPPPYSYEVPFGRGSKGTGVFIPRSTAPRRKSKSRRSSSGESNSKRQMEKPAIVVSSAAKNSRVCEKKFSYSSTVLRRHV